MPYDFKFVDLFAGIGGFHLALKELGGECVFASEWDKFSQATYEENFGIKPHGDITKIDPADIPAHTLLTAGFPCQPFSIAGVSKANALGREHGFKHPTQGTLFFNVKEIIRQKRPDAFILENVKNLISHDEKRTFKVILKTLEEELGYAIFHKVFDAKVVVPQHRERIFIIGFKKRTTPFEFPTLKGKSPVLSSILEKDPDPKYTLTPALWTYLKAYAAKHRAAGNGFGFGLADPDGVSRTLSARYYKDGSEILIPQGKGKRPRRLTPRECAKLMGFPAGFKILRSDSRAYRQFGNSVVVPVVQQVANSVLAALDVQRLAKVG